MSGLNIVGPGGIIEGTTNDVDVNVNLDAPYTLDGAADWFYVADHNDFDLSATLTMSAWIKPTGDGPESWQIIMTKNGVSGDADRPYAFWYKQSDNRVYLYLGDDSANTAMNSGADSITPNAWNHVAATFNDSTNTGKLYVNGVLKATSTSMTTTPYNSTKNFSIGALLDNGTTNGAEFKGEIVDAKLFSDVLTDAEVQELASKINYDITAGSIGNLVAWYKLMGAVADSSGNGHNLTPVGSPAQDYDAFSVNVLDNSTGGSGTFTVTQGKVEGLALTSLDFSGDTQLVSCTSNTFYNGRTAFSVSAWFYHDNSHDGHLLHTIVNARDGGNDGMALSLDSTNDRLRFRIGDGSSDDLYTANDSTENDKWFHVVATRDASNNTAIYINGELSVTGSSSKTISISSGNFGIGGRPSATDADEFSGKIRDVGCWSYALSADQVAALCGGEYNVTPNHEYKIDEGTGSTVADTGTETAADGSITGATWVNGTLDLDGTLTIAANGTLSAPRGNLDLANVAFAKNASGTFTHNNGNVKFSTAGGSSITTSDPVLYDLEVNQGGSNLDVTTNLTIEHNLTVTSGMLRPQPDTKGSELTITFGTTSYASQLELDNYGIGFESGGNNTHACALVGASSLYPFKVLSSSSAGIDLDSGGSSSKVKLANIDYDKDITSGGGGVTVTLTGDAEFNAVTVSSGDTLDLNGQRAEFSEALSNSGTMDIDGMLICHKDCDLDVSATANDNKDKATIIMRNTSNKYVDLPDGTYGGLHILGQNRVFVYRAHDLGTTPVTFGANESNDFGNNLTCGNLTVPTNGTLDAATDTFTVAGDFCIGGGLIGKSAIDFEGAGHIQIPDDSALDFTTAMTLEGWVKTTGTGNFQHLICKSGGYYFLTVYNAGGGADGKAMIRIYDGANIDAVGTSKVNDGKWHHIAGTYDTSAGKLKLYVDGKLEAETSNSDAINTSSTDLFLGANDASGASNNLTGDLGRASLWNVALTPAQIKSKMFSDYAGLDSNTGCIAWYEFNEGTGGNGDTTANSVGGSHTGTLGPAGTAPNWADGGAFTYGTSTIDLTGTGDFVLRNNENLKVYNLTMAAASKTTTLVKMTSSSMNVYGTHTVGAGTYTTDGTPSVTYQGGGTVSDGGAGFVANYITYWSSTASVPAAKFRFFISDQAPTNLGGNIVCEGPSGNLGSAYFRGGAYTTNTNNYQVTTPKWVFDASSTYNIGSSTIILNSTDGLSSSSTTSVLSAGPGCIISGTNAATTFKSQQNWEVVGTCENLNVTNEELRVTGQVINCTGDIIQQHPTQDADQQLDYDTADDRDVMLGRDLDKNTELVG